MLTVGIDCDCCLTNIRHKVVEGRNLTISQCVTALSRIYPCIVQDFVCNPITYASTEGLVEQKCLDGTTPPSNHGRKFIKRRHAEYWVKSEFRNWGFSSR
jgi:hypothetical protein